MTDLKTATYPMKVALIYGYKPSGHSSAAYALSEFFPRSIIEPVFINLSDVYPNLGPFVAKTYLQILQKTPALWDYVYDNEMIAMATHQIKTALIPYYADKLSSLLIKKNVKGIISTHALACILLSKREKSLKDVPLFAVITDFYAHMHWPVSGIETYFVPHKTVQENLQQNEISSGKISVSGMPIRKELLETIDVQKERREIGLASKTFTVLVSGGSRGLGDIEKTLEALKPLLGRIQVIVLCGENKRLQRKLEKFYHRYRHMKIFGYFHSSARFLSASDLIIGKPGGVTIAEAICLEKPMIIFEPLPGQEEKNAQFLLKNKIAELAKNKKHLESIVRHALHDHGLMVNAKKHLKELSKPHAAMDIVSKVMEHLLAKNDGN
jgi:processive 1,2-diacylglycerol beta-glucosyltransferase